MKNIISFILFSLLVNNFLSAQEKVSFKVIINESNSLSTMSKDQISKFFLKKATKWENNKEVLPIDLVADSPVRKQFSLIVHKKKIQAIKAYWQRKIFAGRGIPPVEKRSENEVLKFVQENEGAIGYVSASTKIAKYKVKVVEIKN